MDHRTIYYLVCKASCSAAAALREKLVYGSFSSKTIGLLRMHLLSVRSCAARRNPGFHFEWRELIRETKIRKV
jgi:hypothetical protein